MIINVIVIGKTDSDAVQSLVDVYMKRLNFYTKVTFTTLPDVKNTRSLSEDSQRNLEGEMILRQLADGDYVVLLDEAGKQSSSIEFAQWMQRRMNSGIKRLCFVVGGPYGFSKSIYDRCNEKISLSQMTFSHQIIRAIFTEQLYRAFTILNNEPYHHR